MNDNWEVKKLIDVCNIQYGYAFDSSCFCEDNSYPQLIRIRDVVRGYSETFYKGYIPEGYYINKGDYLIGMDGEFHIAPWQSEKALLNQRVCKISASDCNVDERFIFYKMSVVLKQIEDETPFVTVKHLSAKRLNQVKIPIPPLYEQSRIVEELDLLSNIIEKKRQQLSELDNLAQSIFYDMFGDPVTNEKGWEVKPLKDNVYEMFLGPFGSALKVDSYVEKENAYCMVYEQKHAIQGTLDILTHYINKDKYDSLKRFAVKPGDFIMSCRGTIGKLYQLPIDAPLGIIHPSLMKIRIKDNIYHSLYFKYMLVKIVANESTNGNCVQMAITAKELGNRRLPLPPLSLQQLFAQKIEAIEKQKALIKQSIAETEELFNSRMDYYFS